MMISLILGAFWLASQSFIYSATRSLPEQLVHISIAQAQTQIQSQGQTQVQDKTQEQNQTESSQQPKSEQISISKIGMHILSVHELDTTNILLEKMHLPANLDSLSESEQNEKTQKAQETWQYVTVPFTLKDLENLHEWQTFFDRSKDKKIIPIVRLVTRFENESWQQPNRKEIVDQLTALSNLSWPTQKKHIIIFNEVNHAKEWGGEISPQSYADHLSFASQWARAEDTNFVILPAAMDLAAPNGSQTMEAFTYLEAMLTHNPEVFSQIDIWNSHSYPNPGFSAPATATGQNSLRGFEQELKFIKEKTGKELPVMITETGWELNAKTRPRLSANYQYAVGEIWSDSRVLAVTPFILQGDPGPFSAFGFIDSSGKETPHFYALQAAMQDSMYYSQEM